MRRAPILLAATIAGTAAVLGFQPAPPDRGPVAEALLPSVAPPITSSGRPSRDAIHLGPIVANQYGRVQVQIAVSAGKIVDVRAVQVPDGDGTSREINRAAAPQLKQQALTAQSAQVDGVSGATYTSDGYRRSLQAALDKAGAVETARTTGSA